MQDTLAIHHTRIQSSLAVTRYRGGTRKIIADLKFNRRMSRVRAIEDLLERAYESSDKLRNLLATKDLLAIPVPLHSEREKLRGFNQSDLIFRNWLNRHGVEMKCLLKRVVETQASFKLKSKEDRMKNIAGAFELAGDVSNRSILLVDDILTTGTTVEECSRVLKSGGASKIFVLVLASDY